jgi:hypothetical protein
MRALTSSVLPPWSLLLVIGNTDCSVFTTIALASKGVIVQLREARPRWTYTAPRTT